jgi:hypothetical protein
MRLLAFLMLTFSLSAAPTNQVENGFLTYGNETLNSLQINGYVTLNGTTIINLLQVNGSLTATQAQIGEMNVQGQASLNNCTVKNKSMVAGSLVALLSTFNAEVTLASDNSVFDTCSIASIRVRKNNNNLPQIIELKGKTQIIGQITFESGKGQVIASPESQLSPASVIGGTIKKS